MDSQAIEDLNGLLKEELAAIGTYSEVLKKIAKTAPSIKFIQECRDSHQGRVAKLTEAISRLGGQPIAEVGLGAKIAKLIIDGASAISDEAIVSALAEDEAGWSSEYEWRLVSMHGNHRQLVKEELWPQQQQTEEKMRELAKSLNKGLWPATQVLKTFDF